MHYRQTTVVHLHDGDTLAIERDRTGMIGATVRDATGNTVARIEFIGRLDQLDPVALDAVDEDEDDGTMPENVAEFATHVVGHRIKSAEHDGYGSLAITLDDGTVVELVATDDCCANTDVESFLLHADTIDHIITGVGTTDGYTTWHVFADFGDVMEIKVGWSAGNPFYYVYGFDFRVRPAGGGA